MHRMIAACVRTDADCVQECLDSRNLPCRISSVLDDTIERLLINTAPANVPRTHCRTRRPDERTKPDGRNSKIVV
jgi:hypothetical protein